jgi:hypothetical protein
MGEIRVRTRWAEWLQVRCELVRRCEGVVPRWTITNEQGDRLGGDRRWGRSAATGLLVDAGVPEREAEWALNMTTATAPAD